MGLVRTEVSEKYVASVFKVNKYASGNVLEVC
jgi:hypothetical protein